MARFNEPQNLPILRLDCNLLVIQPKGYRKSYITTQTATALNYVFPK